MRVEAGLKRWVAFWNCKKDGKRVLAGEDKVKQKNAKASSV